MITRNSHKSNNSKETSSNETKDEFSTLLLLSMFNITNLNCNIDDWHKKNMEIDMKKEIKIILKL